MAPYDNAYLKLGMGDPCAEQKSVIATWRCFVIEKESISEENLGFDPPTGTATLHLKEYYSTKDLLKCRDGAHARIQQFQTGPYPYEGRINKSYYHLQESNEASRE